MPGGPSVGIPGQFTKDHGEEGKAIVIIFRLQLNSAGEDRHKERSHIAEVVAINLVAFFERLRSLIQDVIWSHRFLLSKIQGTTSLS